MGTTPYYADEMVTLYHGRHEDILPTLGLTFDLIVADPPYGETSLDWDRWPDGWPALMQDYARSMWCFGSLRMFLDRRDEFAGWKMSQDVVWQKHRASSVATDRFARTHEHVLHWYHGKWADVYSVPPTINHEGPLRRRPRKTGVTAGVRGRLNSAPDWVDDGRRMHPSVIKTPSVNRAHRLNETEKPLALLRLLTYYGVAPGGLILDPFAGSGATAIAARERTVRTVCIEQRESQCDLAAARLSQSALEFEELS